MKISAFVVDWLRTREWAPCIGLLLTILCASAFAFFSFSPQLSRDILALRYYEYGLKRLGATDENSLAVQIDPFSEAVFRKVIQLRDNDSRSNYFVASSLAQRGKLEEGLVMMRTLAPRDRKGYENAHIWMTQYLLIKNNPEDALELQHHLRIARQTPHVPPEVLARAAEHFYRRLDFRQALSLYEQAAKSDWSYRLLYFRLAVLTKDETIAESTATTEIPRLEQLLANQEATTQDRIALQEYYLYRGKTEAAIQVLRDAENQTGLSENDSLMLQRATSELFRRLFLKSESAEIADGNWNGRLEYLDFALRADPSNPRVAEEVARLARLNGPRPSDELLKQLEQFLASGQATAITHAWIAEARILREEYSPAIHHLKQVVQRAPDAYQSHNNLAYALALQDTDLEIALKHAQIASSAQPQRPDFQDTLGVVLLKLNKPSEALTAFEKALGIANLPIYHQHTSEAYSALGMESLAETHRELAKSLESN